MNESLKTNALTEEDANTNQQNSNPDSKSDDMPESSLPADPNDKSIISGKAVRTAIVFCAAFALLSSGFAIYSFHIASVDKKRVELLEKSVSEASAQLNELSTKLDRSNQSLVEAATKATRLNEDINADMEMLATFKQSQANSLSVAPEDIEAIKAQRDETFLRTKALLLCYLEEYSRVRSDHSAEVKTSDDIFKDYAIERLVGGIVDADTAKSAAKSVVEGISKGDSFDKIKNGALDSAMEALPSDIMSAIAGQLVDNSIVNGISSLKNFITGGKAAPQQYINQLTSQSKTYAKSMETFLSAKVDNEAVFRECVRNVENMLAAMRDLQKVLGEDTDINADLWELCSWDMEAMHNAYVRDTQKIERLSKEAANNDEADNTAENE